MEKLDVDLFFALSLEKLEEVPVNYMVACEIPSAHITIRRYVSSEVYRAPGYGCADFVKPISRCLRYRPPGVAR